MSPLDAPLGVAGADADGHDWALHGSVGGVLAGVPTAEEVRWYDASAFAEGTDPTATLAGEGVADRFGASLAVLAEGGDAPTLLVGAPHHSPGPTAASAGAVFLYDGVGAALDGASAPTVTVSGTGAEDQLGTGVWACGDLDADGTDDWAASAPWAAGADGDAELAGAVYLGLSSAPPLDADATVDALVHLAGTQAGERFGAAITCTTSLDGDPYPELVVGAPYATSEHLAAAGLVELWRGSVALADEAPTIMSLGGAEAGDYFGASVAVGDLDGDGRDELVVGAPGHDSSMGAGDDAAGAVYIFAADGLETHLNLPEFTVGALAPTRVLRGEFARGRFGASVAVADLDGDGIGDLVVGAPGTNPTGEKSAALAGEVTIWHGSIADWPEVRFASGADATIVASRQYLETGGVLTTADLDEDGAADLVLLNRGASTDE